VTRLADQYQMSEPQAVQLCSDAMLSHIEGRFAQSRLRYAEGAAQMRRDGSLYADGFHGLALLMIHISEGTVAEAEPIARALHDEAGPPAADAWAVTLAAAGQMADARAAGQPLRRDFFYSVFATLRAMAMIALGESAGGQAETLARRWNSPHWTERARTARAGL